MRKFENLSIENYKNVTIKFILKIATVNALEM